MTLNGATMETVDGLHPLASLLRRYAFGYTAAHDFRVCESLMVEGYVLRMGEHELRGRDRDYIAATAKQYRQFPGLGFTVHELVLGEDRAALHFTEHGRSTLSHTTAAWSGVSLYRWDGARLTHCRVEQDYYGRREQLRTGRVHAVSPPGIDPWTTESAPPDPGVEAVVHRWLCAGGLSDAALGSLDSEPHGPVRRMLLSAAQVSVLDLFSAGDRVAFHVLISGRYAGGLDALDAYRHQPASLYVAGLVRVCDGAVREVRAVTDRLAAERRLDAARGTLG
jgi:predicted ester cyclase